MLPKIPPFAFENAILGPILGFFISIFQEILAS
jgi:hypothetical protein